MILGRKAGLLLDLLPNTICLAVQEAISTTAEEIQTHQQQILLCPELSNPIDNRLEVPSSTQESSSKQLGEASEFLMSDVRDPGLLRSMLLRASVHTLTRMAGLRAFMLLFDKVDMEVSQGIGKLPALSTIAMQPAAVEFLFLAFRRLSDEVVPWEGIPTTTSTTTGTSSSSGRATSPVPSTTIHSTTQNSTNNTQSTTHSTPGLSGHYSDGLQGANATLLGDLKISFESIFEFITQLLSRCTWAGDRDGQCISLACWGIRIKPDDHVFLNRAGIFRVLQTVLDDARTSMALVSSEKTRTTPSPSVTNTLGVSPNTFSFKLPGSTRPSTSGGEFVAFYIIMMMMFA